MLSDAPLEVSDLSRFWHMADIRDRSISLLDVNAFRIRQFNSILLAPESRDITSTWIPLGLMRWLRLIMGTKDASGRAQQEYTKAMAKYLSNEEKEHMANFQDDFLGFHDEISPLLRVFEGFLKMCRKAGITLNPAKIHIGIKKAKFYGVFF